MIYRHKPSGDLYRLITHSFSVERQRHSVVYMKIDSGQIFDRDTDAFHRNFEFISDAQNSIEPRDERQTIFKGL